MGNKKRKKGMQAFGKTLTKKKAKKGMQAFGKTLTKKKAKKGMGAIGWLLVSLFIGVAVLIFVFVLYFGLGKGLFGVPDFLKNIKNIFSGG